MIKKLRTLFITIMFACITASVCLFAACSEKDEGQIPPSDGTQTVAVESVTLNKTTLTLEEGEEETLTATVFPDNATDKTVSWTSSAEAVATVSGGKVTAVAAGTSVITATAGGKSATCTVLVSKRFIYAESISLNKSSLTLEIGSEETLNVIFNPENATDKSVKWNAINKNIATVDGSGKVTEIAEGTTTVIVDAGNLRATCLVTVIPVAVRAESVTLNKNGLTLEIGDAETLTATVLPVDTTDKTVTWSSSAPDIASIDANGKVTAVAAGNATITAKTENNKTATCTVTVNEPTVEVDTVILNKTELTLEIGSEETLIASVTPNNATDKTVTWRSSAPDIASVDANGKVTAVAVGSVTVTVKSGNNRTATCTVTVIEVRPKSLDFTKLEDANGNISYAVNGIGNITDSVIEIPAEHDGNPVTKIGANAFEYCSDLTSVTIPESVTIIDSRAFYGCEGLLSINLHEGIDIIQYEAFLGCKKLTSVTIPASLKTLGYNAFRNCSGLTSVNIREGITYIPSGAFQYCGDLKSVTIPDSVESIGNRAFDSCLNLESVTIPDAVTSLGISVFYLCRSLSSITFGSGLFVSNQSNFYNCSVKEIHFTGNLSEWCKLTWLSELDRSSSFQLYIGEEEVTGDIIIPEGVTCIEAQAFRNCIGITSVSLPDSLTEIGTEAFRYCQNLTRITIPDGVKKLAIMRLCTVK